MKVRQTPEFLEVALSEAGGQLRGDEAAKDDDRQDKHGMAPFALFLPIPDLKVDAALQHVQRPTRFSVRKRGV